jgi:glycogen operon protein
LGRNDRGFATDAAFFIALRQDPVLATVHLIAEPWDGGAGGYQLGHFPGRFMEWNDKFRDAVRGYWLQTGVDRAEFARRLTASSDLFHHNGRTPCATVNFLSVHDGFTLADVVSYSQKHNADNGEDNADGRDGELCANFGTEGATDDPAVRTRRQQVQRAMLASLFLAQGTPMLCAGDEIGNSQQGNNNAYCLDNPVTWLQWLDADTDMQNFVAKLITLRKSEPALHSNVWSISSHLKPGAVIRRWLTPTGHNMQTADWHDTRMLAFAGELQVQLTAASDAGQQPRLLLLFNPQADPVAFSLPAGNWSLRLDSNELMPLGQLTSLTMQVPAHTVLVLRETIFSTD